MNVTLLKALLLLVCAGHMVLWYCDKIITCLEGGRFSFRALQENETLSSVMGNTPLRQPMNSMVWGVFAMTAAFFGYLALCGWMRQFSAAYAALMLVGCVLFFLSGVAHHVFCGAVEWFYLRMGKTEEARKSITEFFGKTSVTMYSCYLGLLLFAVSFFIAVLTGTTALPRWACVFNTLPLFLIMLPFRVVGTGNLANAVMFLGLFFLM